MVNSWDSVHTSENKLTTYFIGKISNVNIFILDSFLLPYLLQPAIFQQYVCYQCSMQSVVHILFRFLELVQQCVLCLRESDILLNTLLCAVKSVFLAFQILRKVKYLCLFLNFIQLIKIIFLLCYLICWLSVAPSATDVDQEICSLSSSLSAEINVELANVLCCY